MTGQGISQAKKYDELFLHLLAEIIEPYLGKDYILENNSSFDQVLEEFFNIDTREIYFLEVLAPFKIPGNYWSPSGRTPKDFGKRPVGIGSRLLIRYDISDPDNYIVQRDIAAGYDSVFLLTKEQWNDTVRDKVKVVYKSELTGKDPTLARRNKVYHERFVADHLGCGFEFKTALGYSRANWKRSRKKIPHPFDESS